MYASYEYSKRMLTSWNGGTFSTRDAFAAGWVSGMFEAVTVTPFQVPSMPSAWPSDIGRAVQVVKIRLQAKEHLSLYRNTFDATLKIFKNDGLRAFSVGMAPTVWRNSMWNSVYFSFM